MHKKVIIFPIIIKICSVQMVRATAWSSDQDYMKSFASLPKSSRASSYIVVSSL